jgi:hypothetical protein
MGASIGAIVTRSNNTIPETGSTEDSDSFIFSLSIVLGKAFNLNSFFPQFTV